MRHLFVILSMLIFPMTAAHAEVSVGIGFSAPGISIGINLPAYPRLVPVPGYPVYYDPRVDGNYFFYDGMYWVLQGDNWYASGWYNGPWHMVEPVYVPLYVLRVPVRYYRRPPPYFHGWHTEAPPRWGDHWGRDWEKQHGGWEKWDRRSAPRSAPLPSYQRKYYGEQYPREPERQHTIRSEKYRYQPRETVSKQYYQQQRNQGGSQNRGQGKNSQEHNRERN